MAKRQNNEGTWGVKTIKGYKYHFYRNSDKKYFYGKTVKEVQEKVDNYNNSSSQLLVNNKTTVYEYSKYWLTTKENLIKSKTYDGYEYIIEYVIADTSQFDIKNKQIQNVTEKQLQSYFDGLIYKHAKSTIIKTKAIFNQIFNLAKKEKIVSYNIVSDIKIPIEDKIAKKTKTISFLNDEDIIKLEKEAENKLYSCNARMIVFILHTGLRISELIGLEWEDVDFDNRVIHIKNNKVLIKNRNKNDDNKYNFYNTTPKTNSGMRSIPLSDKAYEIILEMKGRHNKYVFVTSNGNTIYPANLTRTLNKMLKRANCSIQKCGLHTLRHSFGSTLIRNGVDIKVVSKLLGHSKISTTYDIYIHILEESKKEAINIFNRV